jgi:Domain of unknown function (DUF4157)
MREREIAAPAPAARRGRHAPRQVLRIVSAIGNAAFGRLARDGAGLLPDGRVHPEVEQAIAAARGGGRPLDATVRESVAPALGDALDDVRVHDDAQAAELARSVNARAFTTGSDVYFGSGEYRPGTADGDRLLAHELTHVVQQRGAPTAGPLAVSEPADSSEREAEAVARDISG